MTEQRIERRKRALKLRRKRFNERLKMIANYVHGVALAVLGLGVLRFLFDPAADALEWWRLAVAVFVSFAFEVGALYILGWTQPED